MKRQFIIGFIVLCITSVNVFAIGNFINQQNSHHSKFCALLDSDHHHHHMHHGIGHTHGHSHKVNLVDIYTASTFDLSVPPIDYENPLYQKQWFVEPRLLQLLRPPIT